MFNKKLKPFIISKFKILMRIKFQNFILKFLEIILNKDLEQIKTNQVLFLKMLSYKIKLKSNLKKIAKH